MTRKKTYGDFQTPLHLARQVCRLLGSLDIAPCSIVEPTCGTGNFIVAACEVFGSARVGLAVDVNEAYVKAASCAVASCAQGKVLQVERADFFQYDWKAALEPLPEPLLILGNPPWVTNAGMTRLGGANLPSKSNLSGLRGLEARTGKSNFDIAEWMIWHLAQVVSHRRATLAFLCKSSVARRVLLRTSRLGFRVKQASVFNVDAKRNFGVNADACLLVIDIDPRAETLQDWATRSALDADAEPKQMGVRDGLLVSDIALFETWRHLRGRGPYTWRSGVKHDCASVMELIREGNLYRNGLGELVQIENDCVYPLLKGSDVGNGRRQDRRYVVVTQRDMNDQTSALQDTCPQTWTYLCSHASALDNRASIIYKGRPRFCMFGVGEYVFSPWKVAISSLYKRLVFRVVGPSDNKPVVFDDTVYYAFCQSEEEARLLERILNSEIATQFLSALVFWDAKRPITIDILKQLDIRMLARALGVEQELLSFVGGNQLDVVLE